MKDHMGSIALLGGLAVGGLLVLAWAAGGNADDERLVQRRAEGKVADIPVEQWTNVLLAKTSAHEGTYWSVQRNLDGQGVSYGIIQWTQRGGGLFEVLSAMQAADPNAFARIFGPSWAKVLDVARRKSLEPVDGAALWNEPWLSRFREAGRHPPFQAAQRRTAIGSDYMKAALQIADLLGVYTERAMTVYYNRTVHQGPAGALGPARRLAEFYAANPGKRPEQDSVVLAQYGWYCAAKFRRTTPPDGACFNSACTIKWVQLQPGSLEVELETDLDTGGVRLVRVPQVGPTWHAVTGPWDLWDLIIQRTAEILNDGSLRDQVVARA